MVETNDKELEKLAVGTSEQEFYKEMEKYEVTSFEEIRQLIQEYRKGNISARNEIVKRNLRLLVAPAKKYAYRTTHLKFMDFIQEGILGMMRSLETYNPEEGAFSTYVLKEIETFMRNAIRDTEKEISEPGYLNVLSNKYKKILAEEKDITDEEICRRFNISMEILEYVKNPKKIRVVSMNKTINEEKDSSLEVFIADEDELTSYDRVINEESDRLLYAFLKYILSSKEYFILYFRDLNPNPVKLETLGKEVGATREGVRLIEKKTREKLEKYFKNGEKFYYKKLKLIDPNVLRRMKKQPLLPKDITKYLYLKGFLTDTEFNIYYYLFIGKEHLNLEEMASLLNITTEEVKNAISNIKKIRNNMDKEEFESYHEDLINRLGFEIYKFAIYGAIPPKEDDQNKFRNRRKKTND